LVDISNNMMGNTICAFADGTAMPMLGLLQKFREEFVEAGKRGIPAHTLGATARTLGGIA
jgi:NADH-quinone oxidoreductase subunit F